MAIQTRILNGFDDPSFGRDDWEKLLHSGETNTVFLTWEWQRVWWEVFGQGQLLLVVAEQQGEPVALAPFYTDAGMIYFIGSGFESYHLDFIGETSDSEVLEALLETARDFVPNFVGFKFYFVADHAPTRRRLEAAAAKLGFESYEQWDVTAMTMDLLTDPVAARAATRKKSLVRHENFFKREGTLKVEHFREAAAVRPQLAEFFAQHITRWAGTDSPSLFLASAGRTFFERWMEMASERGWLRFTRVEWSGTPIAFHFGFNYQGRFIWYKPTFAIEVARHSPGEVLLRQVLLGAIEEGARLFDLGTGDDEYKFRFATDFDRVRAFAFYPGSNDDHPSGDSKDSSHRVR
jgi:CelD/BcsL family acetyltransferase involved in cellulose biosynthesis